MKFESIDDLVKHLVGSACQGCKVIPIPATVSSKLSRTAHALLCVSLRGTGGVIPVVFYDDARSSLNGLMFYDLALQGDGPGRLRVVKNRYGERGGLFEVPAPVYRNFAVDHERVESLAGEEA